MMPDESAAPSDSRRTPSSSEEPTKDVLRFLRHATFLLDFGKTRWLCDPMYMGKGKALPVPSVLDFRRNPLQELPEKIPPVPSADILLLTHHHFDHFDRAAAISLPKNMIIVTPRNGQKKLRRLGFTNIRPMKVGETMAFPRFTLFALSVKHAQRLGFLLYKPGLGYLIRTSRKSVYISGDTNLHGKLMSVLGEQPIDLAVLYGGGARLPFLGRHTLSHQEIIEIVSRLQIRKAVVIHLDTLNHCVEDAASLSRLISHHCLDDRIVVPRPGEEIIF